MFLIEKAVSVANFTIFIALSQTAFHNIFLWYNHVYFIDIWYNREFLLHLENNRKMAVKTASVITYEGI